MIARLNYADGRVASIEIADQHAELDVAKCFPPDIAVERGGYPGERVFRCTGDRYNGEVVYQEVVQAENVFEDADEEREGYVRCEATGDWLKRSTAPRADWKMPSAPQCALCTEANELEGIDAPVIMEPIAFLEDGWCLHWCCPLCGGADDPNDIEWPFEPDEYATREQIEALGFQVAY